MPKFILRPALVLSTLVGTLAAPVAAQRAASQTTSRDTISACYVPGSGTVYRVGAPNTPPKCAAGHAEFRLTGSGDGAKPSTAFAGFGADDYPRYLLTDGVRQGTSGFAVTSPSTGSYPPPVQGAGKRFMWSVSRAALRAGLVTGTEWDNANLGAHSAAFGVNVTASGFSSFAVGEYSRATGGNTMSLGSNVTASGFRSIAIGRNNTASGEGAMALGVHATASGSWGVAIGNGVTASAGSGTALGFYTTASGNVSTAMGVRASTNGKWGSFVYGDNAGGGNDVKATADNQFVVRAQHFWLGKNNSVTNPSGHFITTSTGAYLSNGGTWTNSSDVNRKHAFQTVDGEALLGKLATMPVQSWSYRDESDSVRHIGPTAQDFRAAFGLGDAETAIATVDADGVSLAAIQALERRTAAQARALAAVVEDNAALRAELNALRREVQQLRGTR